MAQAARHPLGQAQTSTTARRSHLKGSTLHSPPPDKHEPPPHQTTPSKWLISTIRITQQARVLDAARQAHLKGASNHHRNPGEHELSLQASFKRLTPITTSRRQDRDIVFKQKTNRHLSFQADTRLVRGRAFLSLCRSAQIAPDGYHRHEPAGRGNRQSHATSSRHD